MIHIFQKPGADLIHDQQSQTFFFEFMYLRWLSSNVKKRLPGGSDSCCNCDCNFLVCNRSCNFGREWHHRLKSFTDDDVISLKHFFLSRTFSFLISMNELKKSVSGLFSKNVNKTKSGAYFFPLEKKDNFWCWRNYCEKVRECMGETERVCLYVCVCACVCESERERESKMESEMPRWLLFITMTHLSIWTRFEQICLGSE